MYGHQQIQRGLNANQMNPMMQHHAMMMSSNQPHMMNSPSYGQSMMNPGQQLPQMLQNIPSQTSHIPQNMQAQYVSSASITNQGLSGGHTQAPSSVQQMQSQVSTQLSTQLQQPFSQQIPSNASLLTSDPSSINSPTPMNPPSANSQQAATPATPQQPPSSVQTTSSNFEASSSVPFVSSPDPISVAKILIMKDLRHALVELNRAAAEIIRPSASKQQLDGSVVSHNPLSVNPQSVNPQSVNPPSVNPLSVNPASVKSLDDPNSVEPSDKKSAQNPKDVYLNALNNFLAICDLIEINLSLVQECQKQCTRYDKMTAGELKAVGDMANISYTNYAQGYLDMTTRLRNAVRQTIANADSLLMKTIPKEVGMSTANWESKMEM